MRPHWPAARIECAPLVGGEHNVWVVSVESGGVILPAEAVAFGEMLADLARHASELNATKTAAAREGRRR